MISKNEFPSVVYFFITSIVKRLAEKGWNKNFRTNEIAVISCKHEYNWPAVKLVQKHFSKDKWECKLTHFYKNNDRNIYTWSFQKRI